MQPLTLALTYGEFVIPETDHEILSRHICHPSLANDNLSEWLSRPSWPGT